MRIIIFTLAFLFFSGLVFAVQSRLFEGTLDDKGKLKIEIVLPEKEPFVVQGFLLYRESWRPIHVFWNKVSIWADPGPEYKGLPYRVHLQMP